ncbi:MAG: hypothetical protein OXI87_14950 [Albidovulum sp.]|nr:hypothetical protein [Albidovulum sp.]MDE0306154.1 hypothetical protein [Albidovulum sp.]MDE0531862.1 hypothetical protein [Albidovulum sp.]
MQELHESSGSILTLRQGSASEKEIEDFREIFRSENFSESDSVLLRELFMPGSENELAAFRDLAQSGELNQFSTCLAYPPEEMNERWRLLDEEFVRQLAESATKLPEELKQSLRNIIESQKLAAAAQCAAVQDVVVEGRSVAEIRDGLAAAGENDLEALKSRIRSRLVSEAEGQMSIVSDLTRELGAYVDEVGGQIREDGAIVLPNSITFGRESAQITQQMRDFLERACETWLRVLESSSLDIAEVRFEGHSSPEWGGAASEAEAFMLNLELSQKRAQATLSECFNLIEDDGLRAWARKRMTAVGYSSSRPIVISGQEDLPRSRRVVFSYFSSKERLLEDIGSAVEE